MAAPLAKVDVYTGDRQGGDRVGIRCNDGDVVSVEADRVEQQGAGIDHAHSVCLASLHTHVVPAATCSRHERLSACELLCVVF